jgi:hypothetical protein
MSQNKPFPYRDVWIRASPFKDKKTIVTIEKKYKNGQSIGFTALASLRSMGRLPRSNGVYMLGQKYKALVS